MQGAQAACTSVLDLLHELVNVQTAQPPRLWLVTEDCTSANCSRLTGLGRAPVRGLALAIAQEHPDLRCAHVDLERQPGKSSLQALCDELIGDSREDRIALRNGSRLVQRLLPWRHEPEVRLRGSLRSRLTSSPVDWVRSGFSSRSGWWNTVRGISRWWAAVLRVRPRCKRSTASARSARNCTSHRSMSRSPPTSPVCSRSLRADAPPLAGIIHAAGVLDDGILRDQRWERFAPVLAPKVAGAWNLHLATRHVPLDFFVLFSSTAAVLGHAGQANHAAANAFLDSLAHARRAAGLPAAQHQLGLVGSHRCGFECRHPRTPGTPGHPSARSGAGSRRAVAGARSQ